MVKATNFEFFDSDILMFIDTEGYRNNFYQITVSARYLLCL